MSGEARSRATLDLPYVQESFVEEIQKTGKPVIVILMNGRPLTITWIQQNVSAVIESRYLESKPVMQLLMFFRRLQSKRKTSVTFPRYVGQIPIYYNHKNTGRPYDPKIITHLTIWI